MGLELGPQRSQLLVTEIVLMRERLEDVLLDRSPLLGLLEQLRGRCIKNGVQRSSLPSF